MFETLAPRFLIQCERKYFFLFSMCTRHSFSVLDCHLLVASSEKGNTFFMQWVAETYRLVTNCIEFVQIFAVEESNREISYCLGLHFKLGIEI